MFVKFHEIDKPGSEDNTLDKDKGHSLQLIKPLCIPSYGKREMFSLCLVSAECKIAKSHQVWQGRRNTEHHSACTSSLDFHDPNTDETKTRVSTFKQGLCPVKYVHHFP